MITKRKTDMKEKKARMMDLLVKNQVKKKKGEK
jgi:hypothetical protein